MPASRIRRVKVVEADKPVPLSLSTLHVPHYFGSQHNAKTTEHISQHLLVHIVAQITHKNVGADFLSPLILWGLVDFERFLEEFDKVENFDGVVGIFFGLELDEAVALVLVRNLVSRYVHIYHLSDLQE